MADELKTQATAEAAPEETLLTEKGDTETESKTATEETLLGKDTDAGGEEKKTEGEQKPEEKKPEQKKDEPVVPEKYDLKVPEGMVLNENLVNEFTPIAKELKLTNESAQKLVDLFAKGQAQQLETLNKTRESWRQQVKGDAELNGRLPLAKKALRLADEGAKKLFTETWLGDHPDVVRFLAKVGELVGEDKLIEGAAGGNRSDIPVAKRIYPDMN